MDKVDQLDRVLTSIMKNVCLGLTFSCLFNLFAVELALPFVIVMTQIYMMIFGIALAVVGLVGLTSSFVRLDK